MSKLTEELLSIEADVGRFVGEAMQMHAQNLQTPQVKGAIASTLSFIPISTKTVPKNQLKRHRACELSQDDLNKSVKQKRRRK